MIIYSDIGHERNRITFFWIFEWSLNGAFIVPFQIHITFTCTCVNKQVASDKTHSNVAWRVMLNDVMDSTVQITCLNVLDLNEICLISVTIL